MKPSPGKAAVKKLILKSALAPGDIVMLTAAVRDLHLCYPRLYRTDVRTACPGLWENNPYITPLDEEDPQTRAVDCHYPLIDRCNTTLYHCLHGYIEFLNDTLGLHIRPTAFEGDIHLSELEKSWASQVSELTGREIPFWIVAAGGKFDFTIKWWDVRRYQEVVDHFKNRIQFVQVGEAGHYHPKLEGVIDLRGKTDLRQLVRLVYHAQGILCPVTSLMHLAAAIECMPGGPPNRPCVVIAGGREPNQWEAYPHHQFLHTNGVLPGDLTLVTLYNSPFYDVARITAARMRQYAQIHGYRFVEHRSLLDITRHPAWNKIMAVRKAMSASRAQWILWVDADAVIMNYEHRIEDLIEEGCDLIFGSDFNGLNSAVFLARNCEWCRQFFDAVYSLGDVNYDPDHYGPKWEQNTIKHLLNNFSGINEHVALHPENRMNALPGNYKAGDFILHLGGLSNEERLKALTEYNLRAAD
jgi:hypothetical protein